jgi:hypothetical protein
VVVGAAAASERQSVIPQMSVTPEQLGLLLSSPELAAAEELVTSRLDIPLLPVGPAWPPAAAAIPLTYDQLAALLRAERELLVRFSVALHFDWPVAEAMDEPAHVD